jgi:GH25 family lysozyme M1 (1,4-beta-N-acetylmuramidase)
MDKILGADISAWQDDPNTPAFIDFAKAKSSGLEFVIIRALYGLVPDRIFDKAFDAAKKVGLITGIYTFADYRTYAVSNVAALVKHLGGREPDFVACDLENNEQYWPGMWPSDGGRLTYWVSDWLAAYKSTGLKGRPLLYTNPGIIRLMRAQPLVLAKIVAEMTLWTTWWDPGEPTLTAIAPWTKYHFVQPRPSAVGHQFGVESGNLDLDYWNGTLEELKAFVKHGPVVSLPTLEERVATLEQKLKDHGW